MKTINNQNGIALILVLGVLAVLVILATTFAFNMRLEQKAASNYLDSVNVDCIARIGIEYAISLLHNDITDFSECQGYDWNGDDWGHLDTSNGIFNADGVADQNLDDYSSTTSGSGYGGDDAKWISVTHDGVLVGRYAVLVLDESSKMNINAAGNGTTTKPHQSNEGWTVSEMDLAKLPDITSGIAENIVEYRYGTNNEPGAAGDDDEDNKDILEYDGIDNNADGSIDEPGEGDDEPDEYNSWFLRDDDELFSTTTQIKLVSGITDDIWDSVKNIISVNSRTRNQYWDGSNWQDKININAVANIDELYNAIDGLGIVNLSQKTCNIIDYRDENYIVSTLSKVGTVYGVEPILINEVLARSHKTDTSYTGTLNGPPSHTETYTGLAPNTCYRVTINTSAYDAGQFTVTIPAVAGTTEIVNNNSYPFTSLADCISDASGQLSIKFEDTNLDAEVSTVTSVEFVCAEFVELCNISNTDIDLVTAPAWTIAIGTGGDVDIPAGTIFGGTSNDIGAGSYFVLTNDMQLFAYSYGATKNGTWGDVAAEDIPVADMSGSWTNGYATNGELDDSGEPAGGTEEDIVIKNSDGLFAERAVNTDFNSSNYGSSSGIGVSREKDDPSMRADWNNNGAATAQASPCAINDRITVGKTLPDVYIKTYPFASIGEIADTTNYKGVRSGDVKWQAIQGAASGDDLGLIAERITTDSVRLDAETVTPTGTWSSSSGPYLTSSYKSSPPAVNSGEWEWTAARLQPVAHVLYIYGLYFSDDDYLDVSVYDYANSVWDTDPDLEYQPSDGLKFEIAGESVTTDNIGPDGRFKIRLATDGSQTKDVYFDYLLLVPESVHGKINLNTAALQVLEALPGLSVAQAAAIYGDVHSPEDPYHDLGWVLNATGIGAAEFAPISNLISVHSDVFQIICLAQALDPIGEVAAEKKIKVIVDRSGLPGSALKILSWEEIRN